ncbi:MAG: NAD(P)/FAD-dependent oxidoreductase [Paludibacteraceae bacterium]|nr:NAD(P)/FAD-dependent oxidoreductase [Paludibacteraceae bacterium]
MRRIVIIGAGFGGLATGYLLSKQGENVTILEHQKQPGGCLQSFYRNGLRFDTGLHYLGGLNTGGPLDYFFKELGLTDLPWVKIKDYEVHCGDKHYIIPCGESAWLKYLTNLFPTKKDELNEFIKSLKDITYCPISDTVKYWEQNAWDWLQKTITDPKLRDVISGMSFILELKKENLPLFAFAEILYSYFCSIHILPTGGQPIIDHLTNNINANGGKIRCNATVKQILEKERQVTGVLLDNGEVIEADTVISSINPTALMQMIAENSSIRHIYRRRVKNLECTLGCFTVNLQLRSDYKIKGVSPIYIHKNGSDFWNMDTDKVEQLLIHFYKGQNCADIIVPMSWDSVKQWGDTPAGCRGEDYVRFKEQKLNECLDLVETAIPDFRKAITDHWSSTPLTWQTYLLSPKGTAYGVRKDNNSLETTLLFPRTPLSGLYLTGQSMILHGIMGTTISAFQTASMINNNIKSWPSEL